MASKKMLKKELKAGAFSPLKMASLIFDGLSISLLKRKAPKSTKMKVNQGHLHLNLLEM